MNRKYLEKYKKILAIPYHNESAKEKEKFTIIRDNWC